MYHSCTISISHDVVDSLNSATVDIIMTLFENLYKIIIPTFSDMIIVFLIITYCSQCMIFSSEFFKYYQIACEEVAKQTFSCKMAQRSYIIWVLWLLDRGKLNRGLKVQIT